MEVTRFEAVDGETRETLRRINEETTNQITQLKRQEGENAVRAARMRADISLEEEETRRKVALEQERNSLIRSQAANDLLQKTSDAEGLAQTYAQHAKSFIKAVNETGVSVQSGLDLYKALKDAEHHNVDTQNLASGRATMFLTSSDVKLNIRELNLGQGNDTRSENEL
uniref:Uncharacterized protein n=1 Tax=Zooxanthella nutricula TaxID=1333877 RepID=A0A7S2KD58_9DINO|mmetsp:Transcript_45912/g.139179  ORF Transcript_45912/g.139179 Transcript_45912/m.139179 type:complete len:169 (+) Transcript_45912:1-507(+)